MSLELIRTMMNNQKMFHEHLMEIKEHVADVGTVLEYSEDMMDAHRYIETFAKRLHCSPEQLLWDMHHYSSTGEKVPAGYTPKMLNSINWRSVWILYGLITKDTRKYEDCPYTSSETVRQCAEYV